MQKNFWYRSKIFFGGEYLSFSKFNEAQSFVAMEAKFGAQN